MATPTLPSTPFTLTGGCFCKSIRYTISVPALESRPARKTSSTESEEPEGPLQRWPIITFDHCHSCRRIHGSIVQPWLICPQFWASWTLLPKTQSTTETNSAEVIKPTTIEVLKPSEELKAKTHVSHFSSSEEANRIFCGKCGTGLTYFCDGVDPNAQSWGPLFDIALGSLDDECLEMQGMKPSRQSWVGDGISWVKSLLADGDKTFEI